MLNDNEYIIHFTDNNAGFNMQSVNKLFEVFQRLYLEYDYQRKDVGLTTVKRIIELHNGCV